MKASEFFFKRIKEDLYKLNKPMNATTRAYLIADIIDYVLDLEKELNESK